MTFRRLIQSSLVLFALNAPALAAEGFADVQHNLFVGGRDNTSVAVISTDTDKVIGRLELGLVPRQMHVSESLAKLAAADGRSAQVVIADLVTRGTQAVPLTLTPSRLLVSPDGLILAAIDDHSGAIALIDLLLVREKARLAGPGKIRDVMFGGDGKALFIAADTIDGVAVFDVAAARLTDTLKIPHSVALARAPNGREGFALAAGPQASVVHFDLKTPAVLGQLPVQGAGGLFPTGTGRYLMMPDSTTKALGIVPAQPLKAGLSLKAASGVSAAYSAWFDTVAFVPSGSERKVLVYDLETQQAAGNVAIAGTPGPGVVTPDGGKLFLPIEEASEVVVIDARSRRRSTAIAVGFSPVLAVMAGSYGICH